MEVTWSGRIIYRSGSTGVAPARLRKLHLNAVEMIALRADVSVEDVTRVYEIVLRRLKKMARVKDFLPILVSRRVEYLLTVCRSRG
jgi:hypothetical protein